MQQEGTKERMLVVVASDLDTIVGTQVIVYPLAEGQDMSNPGNIIGNTSSIIAHLIRPGFVRTGESSDSFYLPFVPLDESHILANPIVWTPYSDTLLQELASLRYKEDMETGVERVKKRVRVSLSVPYSGVFNKESGIFMFSPSKRLT